MRSSYHIEAPVEKVFDLFVDPKELSDLSAAGYEVDEVKVTEEGTGTYYSWHARMAGIPFKGFEVLTDVVPNKHITEKSSSAVVGTWDYTFEPEGTGTKLTMEHHSRSIWNLPPLRNLGDRVALRANESFMHRVRDRLETSAN